VGASPEVPSVTNDISTADTADFQDWQLFELSSSDHFLLLGGTRQEQQQVDRSQLDNARRFAAGFAPRQRKSSALFKTLHTSRHAASNERRSAVRPGRCAAGDIFPFCTAPPAPAAATPV
jgi:hypothetical protein